MNQRPGDGREHRGAGPLLVKLIAASHQMTTRVEAALGAVNLSFAKLGILRSLVEAREPLALSQLAERNKCVRSNITQLVDRLEADGLVRRVDQPGDRRVVRATLTAAGRSACVKGEAIVAGLEREVARAVGEADAAAVRRVLGRLAE